MPYNLDLEYRIDHLKDQFGEITKKKMFGGVGYLMNGNMCFGIHKEYLIIRTSIEKAGDLLKREYVKPFDITGKPMKGWLMVSPDYVETDDRLLNMLKLGISFVEKLPKK
jgi:TfoX/Sxy family transcriptional regulator of competence genes